jgi:hypothetical protein
VEWPLIAIRSDRVQKGDPEVLNVSILIAFAFTALLIPSPAITETLSKAELKKLISTAKSAEDHQRIAEYYDAKAAQFDAEAKEARQLAADHRQMAKAAK